MVGTMKAAFSACGPAAWKADQLPKYEGGGSSGPAPFVGILDELSTAPLAAYSRNRLLRAAYAGNAFTARESGGNTTAGIGFDGDGLTDAGALATHCGSNSGYSSVWNDQGPNGFDFKQSTAGNQPRIVNAGTPDTRDGSPILKCLDDGSGATARYMVTDAFTTVNTSVLYAVQVFARTGNQSNGRVLSAVKTGQVDYSGANSASITLYGGVYYGFQNGAPMSASVTAPLNTLQRVIARWDGTNYSTFTNDDTPGTPTASTPSFQINRLSLCTDSISAASFGLPIDIAELFVFAALPSAGDLSLLFADIDAFYGL